ncbi:MAG: 5-dehydro-4-deoxy-D-glucuronate isomerase [Acidobacteriota bacterium]
METRYLMDPESCQMADTDELREKFLLENMFRKGKVSMTYLDSDRAIVGSAVPGKTSLELLSSKKEMAAEYFMERREAGIINIGEKGIVTCDSREYEMEYKDCLYVGRGTKKVEFKSLDESHPAMFYFISFPAHKEYPTTHDNISQAEHQELGSLKDANSRTLNRFIHPNGIKSSQLVMGLTELHEGSVWNTMPVHTHPRRSEIYLYFNLDEDSVVFHFMGEPDKTRHIVVRNHEAVISPSWSIHSGAGTKNYSFIWAMGGENQAFEDMDWVKMDELR